MIRSVTRRKRSRLSRYSRLPIQSRQRGSSISPTSVRKTTEKTSVTAPKAETPTWATPPDTVPAPLAISPACFLNVSTESLPPLTTTAQIAVSDLVDDLWEVVAEPAHRAADRQHEHRGAQTRLQPNRRSIALTTGERTTTPNSETKITSRTFAMEASA